jgi:thiamine transport system substrate-binding protein
VKRLVQSTAIVLIVAACAAPANTPIPIVSQPPNATTQPTPTLSPASPNPTAPASATPTSAPSLGGEVTLVTHDSFAASDSVIANFEAQTGLKLNVLKGGDAGAMVNQAILTKDNPLGDVLYGVDNTFLSRALDAGIFVPYVSPAASELGSQFKLDTQNRVTPIDFGDVCVVYDIQTTASLPASINELTMPAYKGKLVVENPATSSPGLAFMLATIVRFGESGSYTWLDYWRDLRANDVFVANDWDDAYYTEFSAGGGGGKYPFVVSYATDPAADVVFSGDESATPSVQKLDDGCFRQIEFAGVLAGAKNPAGAQAWIDFMASPEFQSDIPLNMFVFPANLSAPVPEVFAQYAAQATDPLTMDPATIAANRDRWIQQWTDTVLH